MSIESNKALVNRFYHDVINEGNFGLADEIMAPDFVDHNAPPGPAPGVEGFKQFISMLGNAFTDIRVEVEDIIAEENNVAARVRVSGTHTGTLLGKIPATGKHATWTGIDIIGIADGKIQERWSERSLLG